MKKSYWQYRIIEHDDQDPPYFAVHEVYYKRGGEIEGWTEEPCKFGGDSVEDVAQALQLALTDTQKPALKLGELERDYNRWYKRLRRWVEWYIATWSASWLDRGIDWGKDAE